LFNKIRQLEISGALVQRATGSQNRARNAYWACQNLQPSVIISNHQSSSRRDMSFSHIGEIFADVMTFELLKWIATGLIISVISGKLRVIALGVGRRLLLGFLIAGEWDCGLSRQALKP
jgi:hypothetical protein